MDRPHLRGRSRRSRWNTRAVASSTPTIFEDERHPPPRRPRRTASFHRDQAGQHEEDGEPREQHPGARSADASQPTKSSGQRRRRLFRGAQAPTSRRGAPALPTDEPERRVGPTQAQQEEEGQSDDDVDRARPRTERVAPGKLGSIPMPPARSGRAERGRPAPPHAPAAFMPGTVPSRPYASGGRRQGFHTRMSPIPLIPGVRRADASPGPTRASLFLADDLVSHPTSAFSTSPGADGRLQHAGSASPTSSPARLPQAGGPAPGTPAPTPSSHPRPHQDLRQAHVVEGSTSWYPRGRLRFPLGLTVSA